VLNWSQGFGPASWDCLVVLPSVAQPNLTPGEQAWARVAAEGAQDKDLPTVGRAPGDDSAPLALLTRELKVLLAPAAR
ncbi:MAG: hypothetical protein ACHQ4G_07945, partial [Opitutales bacterium]